MISCSARALHFKQRIAYDGHTVACTDDTTKEAPPMMMGRQIVLRDMREDDLEAYAHWMHPQHRWHQLDGPYYAKTQPEEIPTLVEDVRQRLRKAYKAPVRTRLAIAEGRADTIIGMVTRYWISQETHWAAVGIAIWDDAHWGKGYGYEALGLWTDYIFINEPDFVRLDLRTWSGNAGMMRLAEKLGYMLEARFRMARIVDGEHYDGIGYGVLRDEWRARYPGGFAAQLTRS
jgi:putative hydrolase of HD superfamily